MKFWIRKVVYAAVSWLIPGGKIAAMTAEVLYRIVMFIKLIYMENGLLSKDLEKQLGKELDKLVDFRKIKYLGLLERFDDKIFILGLRLIDKHYSPYLPTKFRTLVVAFAEAVVAHDWKTAKLLVVRILDMIINVPFVEGKEEVWVIKGAVEALLYVVKTKILNKDVVAEKLADEKAKELAEKEAEELAEKKIADKLIADEKLAAEKKEATAKKKRLAAEKKKNK
jgi:hypothetical protein